ncbi:hypothetical protein [Staphylococcus xylosus]|uniref:hypothetical protein n=1 Tax=Staphylococcus xylosus TaxID=1288 RepID=UPI000E69EDAD|nr:hypothetical protein [Staphylococcus xylosus]RIM77099.1 hypothetical protein BU116_09075 [Staphylococcus xylosus]
MLQESHDIIIKLSWLAFGVVILFGVPTTIIGVYYYKSAKRLPPDNVFQYAMKISIGAFIITVFLWILAWIY